MFFEVIYDYNTIPRSVVPVDCHSSNDISFEILVDNGTFVHQGDNLIRFQFYKSDRFLDGKGTDVIGEYCLPSSYEGYVCGIWGKTNVAYRAFNATSNGGLRLMSISSGPLSALQAKFPSYYIITEDSFSSEKIIVWKCVAGMRVSRYLLSGFAHFEIGFTVKDRLPMMEIVFSKKDCRIRRRDTISFKFEDGEVAHFPVVTAPVIHDKVLSTYSVMAPLTMADVSRFTEKGWEIIRIEHSNGEVPQDIRNTYRDDYTIPESLTAFMYFAQEYQRALNDLGILLIDIQQVASMPEAKPVTEEPCFVYLMVDTTNGYHKIGISNHPEYREKTLQSEKPTIEKICAKRFPSRLIAQSIESALHTAFASKRVRGEWFKLNDEEVAQIKETLK